MMGDRQAAATDGAFRLANEYMTVTFGDGALPLPKVVENALAGARLTLSGARWAFYAGGARLTGDDAEGVEVIGRGESHLKLSLSVRRDGLSLDVTAEHALKGAKLESRYRFENKGEAPVDLTDLVMLDAGFGKAPLEGQRAGKAKAPKGGGQGPGESGEPDALLIGLPGADGRNHRMEGHPVFIGDHAYAGIDWPVAESLIYGGRCVFRHAFVGALAPGEKAASYALTLGVSAKGMAREAFMGHVSSLRGGPPRRMPFYFTWLTHAWEGLSSAELEAYVSYFTRLKDEYSIHFGVFLADAGVAETVGTYWPKQRLMLGSLVPEGLERHVERLRATGYGFGVWLGPDGFGKSEPEFLARKELLIRFVRDWNVTLIKFDVAASSPLYGDRHACELYMRRLRDAMEGCRAANPGLMAINHRITSSPYILTILDTTLWEGMETYPDVYLVNSDKARLFTRHASYGRGVPTYYGTYSRSLEDHGICFNGLHNGWPDEYALQVFGRALLMSPEAYGAMFLLPDGQYGLMSRLHALRDKYAGAFASSRHDEATGAYVHTDGERALACLANDSFLVLETLLDPSAAVGPPTGPEPAETPDRYSATVIYPFNAEPQGPVTVEAGERLRLLQHPFAVTVLAFERVRVAATVKPAKAAKSADKDAASGKAAKAPSKRYAATLRTLPELTLRQASVDLGGMAAAEPDGDSARIAEGVRFRVSSDASELQAYARLAPSRHAEVEKARAAFVRKVRGLYACAANAWDGSAETAWGDVFQAPHLRSNVWRLDLGREARICVVEVTLANVGPGAEANVAALGGASGPPLIEASANLTDWGPGVTHAFFARENRARLAGKVIAEFGGDRAARYIRMHMRGVLVRDIKVTARKESGDDGRPYPLETDRWSGNNLLTARDPITIYASASFRVDNAWPGRYLAIVATLPEGDAAMLHQETAMAWVSSADGGLWPIVDASPMYPFNGWENNTHYAGREWTYRLKVGDDMVKRDLRAHLAWYGTNEAHAAGRRAEAVPTVRLRLVTVTD